MSYRCLAEFSITDEVQHLRFKVRIEEPKLSATSSRTSATRSMGPVFFIQHFRK